MTTNGSKKLAILCGGGPAPGINSVISAVTIEARNAGLGVVGVYDGFEHLIEGDTSHIRPLLIEDVSRIHFQGGTILRTSRANPTKSPEATANVVKALQSQDVSYLVTIGGDDTAFGAATVAHAAGGSLRVAHVPKTIDNDLPLPAGMPTFGYETARYVGTELALTIMEDSRSTNRWFVVVVMGRKAGHLALGIGKSAGATVTIIPEEFEKATLTLDDVSRVIEGAILKRKLNGQSYGVAIVAEGVGERIDPAELVKHAGIDLSYDPYGHIALSDVPLAAMIKHHVQRRFQERGQKITLTDVTLGYELRCHQPIPYDIDYTRTLGYGAVRFLLDENHDPALTEGGFVCMDGVNLRVLPFDDLRDPETGRTRVRVVDVHSEYYRVARDYMIRLNQHDLASDATVGKLAELANLSPEGLRAEFGQLFEAAAVG